MKPKKPTVPADLRRSAQARLQSQTPPPKVAGSADGVHRLLQELQVHHVELEMQNEELRKAHARLEASTARYTDLYDFAPVGYFTLGDQGEIIQANLAGARLLGLERATVISKRFARFVLEADQPAFNTHLQQVFAGQAQQSCEVGIRTNGEPRRFAHLETTLSSDGKECRAVVVDITQRKQGEEALRGSETRLRTITDSAQDAILMMNPGGGISYWNPAAQRIFGYTSAEAIGQNLHSFLVPPRYQEAHLSALPKFGQTGQGSAVGKRPTWRGGEKTARKSQFGYRSPPSKWRVVGMPWVFCATSPSGSARSKRSGGRRP